MPQRIYGGDVAVKLQRFLDLGGQLRILLTEGSAFKSSLEQFSAHKNVSMRQEVDMGADRPRNHFFLVDDEAYRFESEHDTFTGNEFRSDDDFHPEIPARICFNDQPNAAVLREWFDQVWGNSKDIKLEVAGGSLAANTGRD